MHDIILVGGGLANGLIAWRLKSLQPALRILLVEREDALGGNHTWSFYHEDLTPEQHEWIKPMVARRWAGYEVRFPTHRRRLDTPCYSITSERFREILMEALGDAIMLSAAVTDVRKDSVRIGGELFSARVVVDGRGHAASGHMRYAYQKFLGQEVVLRAPHGQALPIIMDATVPQEDGYRFVYTLPFAENRILVEDTYYSDTPDLNPETIRRNIAAYIADRGWDVASVAREETGILPISLSGNVHDFWNEERRGLPCSGLRAGLFHATTGYSLLFAVRLAERIAALDDLDADAVYRHIRQFSVRQWRSQMFMRLLNRMLFFASPPTQRYRLLQRFYKLPQRLIERFFAARLTHFDQFRILVGKPPVPVLPALRAAANTGKEISSKPS